MLGREPSLTRASAAENVGRWLWVDPARTREQLDLSPRGAKDVLAETLSWCATRGWLPDEVSARVLAAHPPSSEWPVET